MAPTKELTERERQLIVDHVFDGKSYAEVSQLLKCSKSTVSKVVKKFKEIGSLKNQKRSGRPRKTSPREDRKLIKHLKKNRFVTSSKLNSEWHKDGVDVSDITVRRRLAEKKYSFCKAKKKPLLTTKHKKDRLKWAKEHKSWSIEQWKQVLFTDESRICLFYGDNCGSHVYRKSEEKFSPDCLLASPKFPRGILIWGAMAANGVGELAIISGTVNTDVYLDILEHYVLASAENLFGDEHFVLQDDNASCHRSKPIVSWLQEKQISHMKWPANSPDLNPIENLWAILKREVKKFKPGTILDLKKCVKSCWKNICPKQCESLILSMPNRISDVIKNKGGATKY